MSAVLPGVPQCEVWHSRGAYSAQCRAVLGLRGTPWGLRGTPWGCVALRGGRAALPGGSLALPGAGNAGLALRWHSAGDNLPEIARKSRGKTPKFAKIGKKALGVPCILASAGGNLARNPANPGGKSPPRPAHRARADAPHLRAPAGFRVGPFTSFLARISRWGDPGILDLRACACP